MCREKLIVLVVNETDDSITMEESRNEIMSHSDRTKQGGVLQLQHLAQ
jgi:hypothetical protein